MCWSVVAEQAVEALEHEETMPDVCTGDKFCNPIVSISCALHSKHHFCLYGMF